jgi:tripartite-type tricarboxylate transporter receptor subunit TctC
MTRTWMIALTLLAVLGAGPAVIAVTPSLPVTNLKDLIALAKQKPGSLNYATAGVGSFQHLAAELFKQQAGIDIVHVPFKGGGPAMMDVIAGNTQIAVGSLAQMIPQIKAGKLKALGVGSKARMPAIPDVPTIAEAGLPSFEVTNWWGVAAPAGTPKPVVEKLHRELAAVVASSETRKRFEAEGADPLQMSPEEFGRFIAQETGKWARVVKEAGIRAE